MTIRPESVDQYLEQGCGRCPKGATPDCKVHFWPDLLNALRTIVLDSGLTETIKWSTPCYTRDGKNILQLAALKDSVVLTFFEGARLADPRQVLEMPGENSWFARYLRFTDVAAVAESEPLIMGFIREAIQLPDAPKPETPKLELPAELSQIFARDPELQAAFERLTPGRQRGYVLHFSSAKQVATRFARIEKYRDAIFSGKGWNDR